MIELDNLSKKPACILLEKSPRRWSKHLRRKLSLSYDLICVDASAIIHHSGYRMLSDELDRIITDSSVTVVFFSIDYFYGIDVEFISRINQSVQKVLVTFDDLSLHSFNSITATSCDLVLTADPLSRLKYIEKGIDAVYFPLESSKTIYRDLGREKKIEVLFFGNTKLADRQYYLDYLQKKGLKIEVYGEVTNYLEESELVQKICESHIVLNFSKTGLLEKELVQESQHRCLWQVKGRLIEVGLCRTVCVSEYAPGIELLYSDAELPTFISPEECHTLLNNLLSHDKEREEIANRIYRRTLSEYEDLPIMSIVGKALSKQRDKQNQRGTNLRATPYWYRRLRLRVRLQHLTGKVREKVYEINNEVFRSNGRMNYLKLMLLIDIVAWSVYDQLLKRFLKHS